MPLKSSSANAVSDLALRAVPTCSTWLLTWLSLYVVELGLAPKKAAWAKQEGLSFETFPWSGDGCSLAMALYEACSNVPEMVRRIEADSKTRHAEGRPHFVIREEVLDALRAHVIALDASNPR